MVTAKRKAELAKLVVWIIREYEKGHEWGSYIAAAEITELYEQLWVWQQLVEYPEIRASIKRFQIAERIYEKEHHENE